MAYSYEIDSPQNTIYLTFSGKVDLPELHELLSEVASNPEINSNRNFLTDLSRAELILTPGEMQGFASAFLEVFEGGTGRSALVLSTPVETALGMLHSENVNQTRQIEIFSTKKAALEWLL